MKHKRYFLNNNFLVIIANISNFQCPFAHSVMHSIISNYVLKDAATGYVSIQTVCPVLWADLYRAWT